MGVPGTTFLIVRYLLQSGEPYLHYTIKRLHRISPCDTRMQSVSGTSDMRVEMCLEEER